MATSGPAPLATAQSSTATASAWTLRQGGPGQETLHFALCPSASNASALTLEPAMTHANGVLGDLGAPAKYPAVEDSSCAGERQDVPLEETAVDHGLKQKAATWDLAQVTRESCETRGTVFTLDCANQCPRSCADLWDGVQCLQGPCSPGCRCPPGQLVQDGHCVPISSCRCGLPSANGSWELAPTQVVQLDCHNWYAAIPPNQGQGL
ncbi:hypothetical protein A6R68_17213 [Neotoma lepida]|uniref:TIL domain-containing protein n=1 Tax=Neotoma lepida TaxID=56216 RepID=A0A1A6HDK2_NEOLE|nr:hypothetical protein A6R68_17213 [Neotoma lepida]